MSRQPRPGRWPHLTHLCALLLALTVTDGRADGADSGALLTAGVMTKLPAFVTWPAESTAANTPSRPFQFCAFGDNAVTEVLPGLLKEARIRGELPIFRRLEDAEAALDTCDLLYLAPPVTPDWTRLSERLQTTVPPPATLVVSDTLQPTDHGVHIRLFREGQRLRLEVDRQAAEAQGLVLGFRLLEMARLRL